MSDNVIAACPMRPDEFSLWEDPSARDLLARWLWQWVHPGVGRGTWKQQTTALAAGIRRTAEMLSSRGSSIWLCLFGPFLAKGVLGAATRLIDDDTGCRFHLPQVDAPQSGPGYVEALLKVEWRPDSLDRLFAASESAPNGVLPCDCRVSLLFVPEPKFAALSAFGLFDADLHATRLREEVQAILTEATHVILPNLDVESCVLGVRDQAIPSMPEVLAAMGVA